ncbi:unnamed protein product [Nippostrongylus brasiliensis]|uniref:Reverse transcriptase domain-containing protein n=1 Tax=Nippostrongylus brasiliensis TaxID=27835 RepID=A0A0N4YD09_NIPBR|nr:unnamed protein product [Nippostrongylus brasiliensis]
MKRKNIHILCLQETRWKGEKVKEIGEGVKLFYKGDDEKRNGAGMAVSEALKDSVSGEEKDEFYMTLDDVIRSVPEGDFLSVAGDLNGHVGTDRRGPKHHPPSEAKDEDGTQSPMVEIAGPKRNGLRSRVMVAGLPDPKEAVSDTWQQVARTFLQCAKEALRETRGGSKGDKATWFWKDEVQKVVREEKRACETWQKSRSSEDLTIYKKYKRLAKAAVAKDKNAEMDGLYEKLEEPQAEEFAFRLAKARHRASLDVRVVKTVKNAKGCLLRTLADVKSRWEEYFKCLLNEEFLREHIPEALELDG